MRWRATRLRLILVALVVLLAADWLQPPRRQLTAKALLGAIDLYQATLSPLMPSAGVQCRFTTTCSHYAESAIRARGAVAGVGLALGRLARCGPWTPPGTVDPPPIPASPAADPSPVSAVDHSPADAP